MHIILFLLLIISYCYLHYLFSMFLPTANIHLSKDPVSFNMVTSRVLCRQCHLIFNQGNMVGFHILSTEITGKLRYIYFKHLEIKAIKSLFSWAMFLPLGISLLILRLLHDWNFNGLWEFTEEITWLMFKQPSCTKEQLVSKYVILNLLKERYVDQRWLK